MTMSAALLASLALVALSSSASIDSVFKPAKGETLVYGQQTTITYKASTDVSEVTLQLWEENAGGLTKMAVEIVPYPFTTPNTGSMSWTIPTTVPPGSNYRIQVHDPRRLAPSPAYSGLFSIIEKRGPCAPGFASDNGVDPCLECDVGSYWVNVTDCIPCPTGKTTEARGARNVAMCNVTVVDPLKKFDIFYQSYMSGANAGGVNLEAVDHKTLDECAQLCLQDKACKSFDAGNPLTGFWYYQTGDCFLSYDNRFTTIPGTFRSGDRHNGKGLGTWVDTCSDNSTCLGRYREPICATDFKTYVNQYCVTCNNATGWHYGECPVQTCANGTACTAPYTARCGSDGQNYVNPECAACNNITDLTIGHCPVNFCSDQRYCGFYDGLIQPVCVTFAGGYRKSVEQRCFFCNQLSLGQVLGYHPCPVDTCSDGSRCAGSTDDANYNPVCGLDSSATYWDPACAACNQQARTYPGACSGGTPQLDYYELARREPIHDVYFIRHQGCMITESDEGGLFESEHSPEACGQLCLNDLNCNSYDAGAAGSTNNDCFLSYDTIASAGSAFTCTDPTYDLYEQVTPAAFSMNLDLDALINRDWTQREALAQSVLAALRAIPGIPSTLDIPIRIVADTVAPGATPRTVVVFNVESDAALINQHPTFRQAVRAQFQTGIVVSHAGLNYPGAVFDVTKKCPPGYASQSGFAPQCERCPVDTYTNGAQTSCLVCAGGTQSPPGSSTVTACRPTAAALAAGESLLFTLGSEWVGTYTTNITDGNITRVAGGGMSFEVVEVSNAPNIRLLATLDHGEFCSGVIFFLYPLCRDAGRAQFYLRGTVVNDTNLAASFDGWIGITDRTFTPEMLNGTVIVNGDNTVFSGVYGTGMFSVTQRCQASTEVGTFTPADKFVGTYECDRQPDPNGAQPLVGEEDIRRLDLFVLSKDALTGKVRALVDFDHAKGPGSFVVEGVYDTKTNLIRLLPVAWQTVHPTNVVARELAGKLSDDGEFFTGQLNLDPACTCTGVNAPSDIGTYGTACGSWGSLPYNWCYVSAGCTEAIAAPTTGFFLAPCSGIATCTNFRLSRVCAEAVPLCEPGWGAHNFRCYKGFNQTATFAEAAAICAAEEAFLSSVHSVNEARIIEDIQVTQAGLGSPVWLGASKTGATEFVWQDGTFLEYINWDRVNGEPNAAQDCATAVSTAGSASATTGGSDFLWSTEACSAKRAFVCRKPPLGRNRTCACTGEVDAQGLGSFCKAWKDPSLPEWCYVSKDCPRAKHFAASSDNLWWAFCSAPNETTTTPGPTTTTTTPGASLGCNAANPAEYQSGGRCVPCATAASCTAGEYIDATPCSNFSSPTCRACDSTCASCSGVGPRACTSCPSGSLLSTVEKVCRASCDTWEYDAGNGKCEPCDTRCGTCSGPLPTDCTSCDQILGSALFLEPSGACGANCDAAGFWKDRLTFTCKPCATCTASQYLAVACTEFAAASCAAVRTCKAGEFQLQAPTATSDRICRVRRTSCLGGQEIAVPATPSSDLICANCEAGTTDADGDYRSPCTACAAGTYTASGTTGPCTPCPVGETDDDSDPATPCAACVQGTSFQDLPGQAGACKSLSLCAPGTQPMAAVTASADVGTCVACPAGLFQPATSVGLCMPWAICGVAEEPSNTPDTSTDRVCTTCRPNFFKAGDGSAACAMAAACAAGFEESTAPTLSSDRACSPCDGVLKFKAAVNSTREDGGQCQAVTMCASNEFEVSAPAPNKDRVCRARTACSATQYLATSPLPNQDYICLSLTTCTAGVQYELTPPSDSLGLGFYTQDRVCTPCTTCPAGLIPDQPCNSTSDQTCKGCTPCVAGSTWSQTVCAVGQATVCAPCSVCPAGRFASAGCTPRADTVCTPFKVCSTTQYVSVPGTATSDAVCSPVTQCAPGTQPRQAPSRTSDRVCAPCRVGSTWKAQTGSFPCIAVTQCAVGQGLSVRASASTDRVCAPCTFGTFSSTMDGQPCLPWSAACDPSEVEVVAPSPSTDRKCLACTGDRYADVNLERCVTRTVCLPGTSESQTPLPTANRQCRACSPLAGEFQDQSGQTSCKRLSPRCGTGLQEAQAPTASSDRRCETCPTGSFKNFVDSAAQPSNRCKAITVCPAGQEEGTPATPSSNRACVFCTAGVTFNDAVGGSCRPVAECGAGLEVSTAATASTDRKCRVCPGGKFKITTTTSVVCQAFTPCSVGTFVSRTGSATADQGCTACDGFLQYQDEANQPQCKISNFCPKGEEEDLPVSARAARTCKPCPSGYFQDNIGPDVECVIWQSCSAGFEADPARPPTASRDRTCVPCPAGTFSYAGAECVPFSECLEGQQESSSGSAASDRGCQTCPPGSYAPRAGAACVAHTSCLDSQQEATAPTTSTDRLCSAAASKSGGASGSLPLIIGIVVGALLLVLVVLVAVFLAKRKGPASVPAAYAASAGNSVAFANPTYSAAPSRTNPMFDAAEPDYLDAKPAGESSGYLDVAPAVEA